MRKERVFYIKRFSKKKKRKLFTKEFSIKNGFPEEIAYQWVLYIKWFSKRNGLLKSFLYEKVFQKKWFTKEFYI